MENKILASNKLDNENVSNGNDIEVHANREHKSRLFSYIFGREETKARHFRYTTA